ncbi:GNAT family N-acetyltransferase [Agromyces aerolatus]|uniref:GNAT family N-acetyltransferase n=1 Tax=Agromyces sp. LY-1074 TaxID=3074080 RepID=UPI00285E072E|nr:MULTISPECIES: GNAT family N-acetyltransferase [unclassified Agromyces]MDR5700687.1 GNAT family N-acetyltransferase [Agromyces sp. LY-1074]MDR5707208.1 GNAT family N-acetyltransferase [Agromyces sp. LY-1358]
MAYEIRPAADEDFFGWLPLFENYCTFYKEGLDDRKALTVWTWLRDPANPFEAALAVDEEGTPVGLAHFRPVPDSLTGTLAYFLDDLFVAEDTRGGGVGRALIEYVHARSAERGSGRVSWITAADNAPAQKLYDSLGRRADWVWYDLGV